MEKEAKREASRRKRDESEGEEDAQAENRYVNDGFVVSDNEEESYQSSEDGALSGQSSEDYYSEEEQAPRARLVRLKDEARAAEAKESGESEESEAEEPSHVGARHNPRLERLFPSAKAPDSEEIERKARLIERSEFNAIFSKVELSKNYETPEDRLVATTDRPERLQFRFAGRAPPTDDELDKEIKWIAERLILLRREWAGAMEEVFVKVKAVLDFLVLGNFEVMYQWLYKRKEFSDGRGGGRVELQLEDLWRVYELDLEWVALYARRRAVKKLFDDLARFTIIPNSLLDYFKRAYSSAGLAHLEAWVEYQIRKYAEDRLLVGEGAQRSLQSAPRPVGENGRTFRRLKRRVFANEMEKAGVKFLMDRVSISCQELAENLEAGARTHAPKQVGESVNEAIGQYVRPDVPELSEKLSAARSICNFIASEYVHYPLVRAQLRHYFERKMALWTEPTDKGRGLSVYTPFYPAKRVQGKRPSEVRPELWLLVCEAAGHGLVTAEFKLRKEELMRELNALICSGREGDKWDFARQEVTQRLVEMFEPDFVKQLRLEMTEAGEEAVVAQCARAFKELLFVKPYRLGEEIRVLAATASKMTAYFVLSDAKGDLAETLVLQNLLKGRRGDDLAHAALYEEDANKLRAFLRQALPAAVVVLPKSLRCHYLKIELSNAMEDPWPMDTPKPFVMWAEPSVPIAAATAFRAQHPEDPVPQPVLEALSAARYLQNPLAETLALWADSDAQNRVLGIKFNELQHLLPQAKLRRALENVAVEVVNLVGVDVNACLRHPRQAHLLSFVCGLGPRKARGLLEKLRLLGSLHARKELLPDRKESSTGILEPLVFVNAAGFLRIDARLDPAHSGESERRDYEWLDFTRVHPDNYPLATKIAREACDDREMDANKAVLQVMRSPKALGSLELEDYADYLAAQKGLQNMVVVLNFIVKELSEPFADPRPEFATRRSKEEVFAALAGEAASEIREEGLVTVRVVSADEIGLRVVFGNRLLGQISRQACDVDLYEDLRAKYPAGTHLKARIKAIFPESLKVRLSATRDDLSNHRLYMSRHDVLGRYGLEEGRTFRVVREEDFPALAVEKPVRSAFRARKITHPAFKNISTRPALERLADSQVGDFLFRPSSRGPDQLNLTWHVSEGVFAHLLVREGPRGPHEAISRTLLLDGHSYESLDDIIANFIKPINTHVARLQSNEKFCAQSHDYVQQTLGELYEANTEKIPYLFWFSPKVPQYLVLSYALQRGQVRHELVKLKPAGLSFHSATFPALPSLVKFFKEKFMGEEYQRFAEAQPALNLAPGQSLLPEAREGEENQLRKRMKEEGRRGVKEEFAQNRGYDDAKRLKSEEFVKGEHRSQPWKPQRSAYDNVKFEHNHA